jgi:hypothetical protein
LPVTEESESEDDHANATMQNTATNNNNNNNNNYQIKPTVAGEHVEVEAKSVSAVNDEASNDLDEQVNVYIDGAIYDGDIRANPENVKDGGIEVSLADEMWGTTGDGDLFLQDEIDETRSFKKLKWI